MAVDRHLIRAATKRNLDGLNPWDMARVAHATELAAPFIHFQPAQLQAAIWVAGQ